MRVLGGALGVVVGLTIVLGLSALAAASNGPSGAAAPVQKPLGPFYNVSFTETGLPSGTTWSVHVAYIGCPCDGVHKTVSSTNSTITIPVTNGSYNFNVLKVAGYYVNGKAHGEFNVSGAALPPVAFVFAPILPYNVEFTETGLPSGTLWTVTTVGNGPGQERSIEDLTESSNTSAMNFTLPNATYHYTVSPIVGSFFLNHTNKGSFVVAGASPPANKVEFSTPPTYALTFTESGLATGTNWSVRINGVGVVPVHTTASSTTDQVTFTVANGSYHYIVAQVLGYVINGSTTGSVSISGAGANVAISFLALQKGAFYPVAFSENGLATGTHWAVTVWITHTFGHSRTETQSASGSTIFFLLQNGSYKFVAHDVLKYNLVGGGSGAFGIVGASPSTFVVNYTAIPTYTMTFTESGLPSGTAWAVLVRSTSSGSTAYPVHTLGLSNSTTMSFAIPNGSYCYKLYPVTGFKLTSGLAAGSFNVTGTNPAGISFGFSPK